MEHARNLKSDTGLSALVPFLKEHKYSFVTPTPATHTRINQRVGNELARTLTDAFGWSRLSHLPFFQVPCSVCCGIAGSFSNARRDGKVRCGHPLWMASFFYIQRFRPSRPMRCFLGLTHTDLPGRSRSIFHPNRVLCCGHWIWDVDRAQEA